MEVKKDQFVTLWTGVQGTVLSTTESTAQINVGGGHTVRANFNEIIAAEDTYTEKDANFLAAKDRLKAYKQSSVATAELSVPQQHQKKIALDTLRMSDEGAMIMGGMSKEEARTFLKSIGYSDERIKKLEASKKQAADASLAPDFGSDVIKNKDAEYFGEGDPVAGGTRYAVSFIGRQNLAIGKTYPIYGYIYATSPEEAKTKAYDRYEHISNFVAKEATSKEATASKVYAPGKVDESKWDDAKNAVKDSSGKNISDFTDKEWATVNTVYQNMGGTFKSKGAKESEEKLSEAEEFLADFDAEIKSDLNIDDTMVYYAATLSDRSVGIQGEALSPSFKTVEEVENFILKHKDEIEKEFEKDAPDFSRFTKQATNQSREEIQQRLTAANSDGDLLQVKCVGKDDIYVGVPESENEEKTEWALYKGNESKVSGEQPVSPVFTLDEVEKVFGKISTTESKKTAGDGRHPTTKSPSDPTFSKEWSGVSYAPHAKGKVCPDCGEALHKEGDNFYCPSCDAYKSPKSAAKKTATTFVVMGMPPGSMVPEVKSPYSTEPEAQKGKQELSFAYPKNWTWRIVRKSDASNKTANVRTPKKDNYSDMRGYLENLTDFFVSETLEKAHKKGGNKAVAEALKERDGEALSEWSVDDIVEFLSKDKTLAHITSSKKTAAHPAEEGSPKYPAGTILVTEDNPQAPEKVYLKVLDYNAEKEEYTLNKRPMNDVEPEKDDQLQGVRFEMSKKELEGDKSLRVFSGFNIESGKPSELVVISKNGDNIKLSFKEFFAIYKPDGEFVATSAKDGQFSESYRKEFGLMVKNVGYEKLASAVAKKRIASKLQAVAKPVKVEGSSAIAEASKRIASKLQKLGAGVGPDGSAVDDENLVTPDWGSLTKAIADSQTQEEAVKKLTDQGWKSTFVPKGQDNEETVAEAVARLWDQTKKEVDPTTPENRASKAIDDVLEKYAAAAEEAITKGKGAPDFYIGDQGEPVEEKEGAERAVYTLYTIRTSDGFDYLGDKLKDAVRDEVSEEELPDDDLDEMIMDYDSDLEKALPPDCGVYTNSDTGDAWVVFYEDLEPTEKTESKKAGLSKTAILKIASLRKKAERLGNYDFDTHAGAIWKLEAGDDGKQKLKRVKKDS
jgi:hypothetical protein